MGKWNRRYIPRPKHRNYDYDDPPLSPPTQYNHHSNSSGAGSNRVPSWEIDYCKSARVPWNKILASKKYIYSYPSVLNWDASAGKEALDDAKQRYWAMINGIPHENPLPNPDIYIQEIDWNPYMDPDLMADLDLQAIDPDDSQKVDKLETIHEEVGCEYDKNQSTDDNPWEGNNTNLNDAAQGWNTMNEEVGCEYDKNQSTNDNPWEKNNTSLKDSAQGWNRWDDCVNVKNDNPWQQSCNQLVESSNDGAWRSGNESWGWTNNNRSAPVVDFGQGWGQTENNSWNWSHGNNTSGQESKNFGNYGNSWENNYSQGSKARGWGENSNESWGQRESEYRDPQRFRGGGRSFRGDCRKRESSLQHTSKYKSSRYHQGDGYGDSRQF